MKTSVFCAAGSRWTRHRSCAFISETIACRICESATPIGLCLYIIFHSFISNCHSFFCYAVLHPSIAKSCHLFSLSHLPHSPISIHTRTWCACLIFVCTRSFVHYDTLVHTRVMYLQYEVPDIIDGHVYIIYETCI